MSQKNNMEEEKIKQLMIEINNRIGDLEQERVTVEDVEFYSNNEHSIYLTVTMQEDKEDEIEFKYFKNSKEEHVEVTQKVNYWRNLNGSLQLLIRANEVSKSLVIPEEIEKKRKIRQLKRELIELGENIELD